MGCIRAVTAVAVAGLAFGQPLASKAAEPAAADATAVADLFERHVRPVLVERCTGCHGPDTAFASLRLDSRAGLVAGGDGGPVAFPGTPRPGELSRRLRHGDDTVRMPPPEAGPRLSPDVIAAIETWLAAGAPWPSAHESPAAPAPPHWAFLPRQPGAGAPAADSTTAIDTFVDARLHAAGLSRSPAADRRTLIRRASFAL
ncbi:MAG: hypothetical protein EBR86_15425, partial [Planctomycetia bacterium]|nr:hypothetical protein [Planctomycetia bacterium]